MRVGLRSKVLVLCVLAVVSGAAPAAARSHKSKIEPAIAVVLTCPGGVLSVQVAWSDGAGGKGRIELHVYEVGVAHEHHYTRDLFKSPSGIWDVDVGDHSGVYAAQAEPYFGRNWVPKAVGQGDVICPNGT